MLVVGVAADCTTPAGHHRGDQARNEVWRSTPNKAIETDAKRRAAGHWRLDTPRIPKLGTARSSWYQGDVGGQSTIGLRRITTDPAVMGGKPRIRGLRVTVGTIVGLVATGHREEEISQNGFREATRAAVVGALRSACGERLHRKGFGELR